MATVPLADSHEENLLRQAEGQRNALHSHLFKIKKKSVMGVKDCLGSQKVLQMLG